MAGEGGLASCWAGASPGSAGWGGDDFTPQKCLNQRIIQLGIRLGSGPFSGGGAGGGDLSVGTGGQDGWLAPTTHSSGVGPMVLGVSGKK